MFSFIISVIIIIALLLVLVVLAQNSKGGGLSSQFGGSSTSQLMGVKKTGDILEKVTWGLAIALLVLSLSTSALHTTEPTGPTSPNIERARQNPIMPGLSPIDGGGGAIEDDTLGAPELPDVE
jgi:preprotein translocase subunit SecG